MRRDARSAASSAPLRDAAYRVCVLLAALALGLAGCDDDLPTAVGDDPAPGVTILFDDPDGELAGSAATIRSLVESTFARARVLIPVDGVTFTVIADPLRTIGGWGIGGFTLGASAIDLTVDPGFPGLDRVLVERLSLAAAHELHHVARIRGPGYGTTLFEAMVSEGLADHFSLELQGGPVPPWTMALPPAERDVYWRLAEPELDGPIDYARWFFGERPGIPRWTGYTLGYDLVADTLARQGRTAAQLVHAPASLFRRE